MSRRLDDIKGRHKWGYLAVERSMRVDDRAWLIAEVERLTAEGSLWADMNEAVADEHERAEELERRVSALTAENAALRPIVERIMTQHWDMAACCCWVCNEGRAAGCRPRDQYLAFKHPDEKRERVTVEWAAAGVVVSDTAREETR